jgi:hypothetical protein
MPEKEGKRRENIDVQLKHVVFIHIVNRIKRFEGIACTSHVHKVLEQVVTTNCYVFTWPAINGKDLSEREDD